jgi:hypothetical protein
MSNGGTDCAAELGIRIFRKSGDEDKRTIQSLELENFELRNEVTRLTVHNATLRQMLKNRGLKDE